MASLRETESLRQAIQDGDLQPFQPQETPASPPLRRRLAQRGDLAQAIESFRIALELAQKAGLRFLEVLSHNNLAQTHSLFLPRQYLYSTRGEIDLAEGRLDEAKVPPPMGSRARSARG